MLRNSFNAAWEKATYCQLATHLQTKVRLWVPRTWMFQSNFIKTFFNKEWWSSLAQLMRAYLYWSPTIPKRLWCAYILCTIRWKWPFAVDVMWSTKLDWNFQWGWCLVIHGACQLKLAFVVVLSMAVVVTFGVLDPCSKGGQAMHTLAVIGPVPTLEMWRRIDPQIKMGAMAKWSYAYIEVDNYDRVPSQSIH